MSVSEVLEAASQSLSSESAVASTRYGVRGLGSSAIARSKAVRASAGLLLRSQAEPSATQAGANLGAASTTARRGASAPAQSPASMCLMTRAQGLAAARGTPFATSGTSLGAARESTKFGNRG